MLRVYRRFIEFRYTASHADSGKRRRNETLYGVARKRPNLLKVSLVTSAAMLAMCLLALVETTNTAEADDSLPENGKLAFSEVQEFPGEDFEIYTMLPDGTNVRQVTDKKGRDQKPTWSSDGTKLGWVHGGGQFWVHDFETGRQRMVVNIRGGVDSAVVRSPDSTKLAYSKATPEGKEADIYVMKADGTNKTNLTDTPSVAEWEITWSPDGSKLAYTGPAWSTTRETDLDIYVMNSDGTNPVNLTDNMPEGISVSYANWSPDGKKIAFLGGPSEDAPGRSGIYIMNADGTNPVNITTPTTPDLYGPPVWSPDSTKMAFHTCLGEYEQKCNIYVMNADGTNSVNITNKPEGYYGFGTDAGHTLDWQPLPEPSEAELEKQHEEHQANQQQQPQEGSKSRSMTVHSPDTGGPSLLLVAIALLFSGGVMFYAGLKRRM